MDCDGVAVAPQARNTHTLSLFVNLDSVFQKVSIGPRSAKIQKGLVLAFDLVMSCTCSEITRRYKGLNEKKHGQRKTTHGAVYVSLSGVYVCMGVNVN